MDPQQPEPEPGDGMRAEIEGERETSRLRWPDKNGGQKIVRHTAYLGTINSKEESPRPLFHAPVYDSQGYLVATACERAVRLMPTISLTPLSVRLGDI